MASFSRSITNQLLICQKGVSHVDKCQWCNVHRLMSFEHRWHSLAQIKHNGQEWWLVHYIQLSCLNRGCRCARSTHSFSTKESKLTVKALMEQNSPKGTNIINIPQDKHLCELFSLVHQLNIWVISYNNAGVTQITRKQFAASFSLGDTMPK